MKRKRRTEKMKFF